MGVKGKATTLSILVLYSSLIFAYPIPFNPLRTRSGNRIRPRPFSLTSSKCRKNSSIIKHFPSGGAENRREYGLNLSPVTADLTEAMTTPKIIPITILAGFLGSGKTTLLQHLLHNNDGLKIAVIVNDVASVNIDSKLVISSKSNDIDVIELSNGCLCCSLSDELLTTISDLITGSDLRQNGSYDHIVVELSGVADPNQIRSQFQDAAMYKMPLLERIQLDTMVTVVDCGSFLRHLRSTKDATPEDSPELFYRNEEERIEAEQESSDLLPSFFQAINAATNGDTMSSSTLAVVKLLMCQTETADILLLNKVDQCENESELDEVKKVVEVLNPRAQILSTSFGKVDKIEDILGAMEGNGVVESGIVDDHKDAVLAAKTSDEAHVDESHSHSHSHGHEDSVDQSISLSHSHSHSHENELLEHGDHSESHSHTHSHSHSHSHSYTHSHSEHEPVHSTIGSFVYSARRPFHPHRLLHIFLKNLPVTRGLETENNGANETDPETKKLLSCVLRSKGFTWLAHSNIAALYWSHAGTSFEMQVLGRWWATLPRSQWPEEMVEEVLADFDDIEHDESSLSNSVGDRRQEVVIIGTFSTNTKTEISKLLDECLLTDEEWEAYLQHSCKEEKLSEEFPNDIRLKLVSF